MYHQPSAVSPWKCPVAIFPRMALRKWRELIIVARAGKACHEEGILTLLELYGVASDWSAEVLGAQLPPFG